MKAATLLRQAAHRAKDDPVGASTLAQMAIDILRDPSNCQLLGKPYYAKDPLRKQAQ